MQVWITKYAISSGVIEIEAEHASNSDMVCYRPLGANYDQIAYKGEWFADESAAIARAELMRDNKIASLKKQIARLEKMTFGTSK